MSWMGSDLISAMVFATEVQIGKIDKNVFEDEDLVTTPTNELKEGGRC